MRNKTAINNRKFPKKQKYQEQEKEGRMQKPIISFAGFSDSGKTTLMEAVIQRLTEDHGLRIFSIKHDAHEFEIDHPGKDSYRFKAAGSAGVAIFNEDTLAVVMDLKKPITLDELIAGLPEVDLYLTEGYKLGEQKKILVFRTIEDYHKLQELSLENPIAIATNLLDFHHKDLPILNLDQPREVADFILEQVIKSEASK